MNVVKTSSQLVFYIALYLLAEQLVNFFSFSLPANIIGMVILLMLLATKIVPVGLVKRGSIWLLSEMLLFFVPAVVAIVNYFTVLGDYGFRILGVIVISTVLVLSITALVVDFLYKREVKKL